MGILVGSAPGEVGVRVVAGLASGGFGFGRFGVFLDAPPEPEQGHHARHGHDHGHGVQDDRVATAKSARMNAGMAATLPLPPCSWAIFDASAAAAGGQPLGRSARR